MAAETTAHRVLENARDLFVERGAAGVTMRAVASRSGVSAMAIYRHYANRDALLKAVVAQGHGVFLAYLQRALGEATPWARFETAGRQYLRFALDHPRDYAVLFMTSAHLEGRGKGARTWQEAATFRFLVDRIRECADAGLLAAPDAEAAALTIWAQVHGLVSLYLAEKLHLGRPAFEKLYESSLAELVRAFTVKAAR